MFAVYLISTAEKAKKNEYKFGKHKGTVSDLISRYTTYLIRPIIYFYCVVNNNVFIENLVKKQYKKYRICSEKGTHTEWFKLELTELVNKITLIINEHNCIDDIGEDDVSKEEKMNTNIIPFGDNLNMDYTYEEIISALKENKEYKCFGLIRLLHFDKNKKENHNVYKTSVKGLWTIYTRDGIEKTNDVKKIYDETERFIELISKKYGKKLVEDEKNHLLEKAKEEISYDLGRREGFERECFLKDLQRLFLNEVPLLFYNKRQIIISTINDAL